MKNIVKIGLFTGSVILILTGCSTWNGVKQDSRVVKKEVKKVSKEAWHDGKKAVHNATAE